MSDRKHIRRRFERAATTFDDADFVHAFTRDGLLQRIEALIVEADIVLDLGAATGSANRALDKRFASARVVAVDLAHSMLLEARRKKPWLSRTCFVQADAQALPFADASVDVVFANMLLPSFENPDPIFAEIARVLKKGGVFAFATLGPDSLQEIRRAWDAVDDTPHVRQFADMHDIGDGLVRAGFSDPVLDVDRLEVSYANSSSLLKDLTAAGARNALAKRRSTLTGKARFDAMLAALDQCKAGGKLTLDLELVFGHCWGGGPKMDPSNIRIDAGRIPMRR